MFKWSRFISESKYPFDQIVFLTIIGNTGNKNVYEMNVDFYEIVDQTSIGEDDRYFKSIGFTRSIRFWGENNNFLWDSGGGGG